MEMLLFDDRYDPTRFKPVVNDQNGWLTKPRGGLWTSPLRKGTTPWITFAENVGLTTATTTVTIISPLPHARVLHLGDDDTFDMVLDAYSHDEPGPHGAQLLDFERIAQDHDAIEVPSLRVAHHPSFYGWDVPTTLWLHQEFTYEVCDFAPDVLILAAS